MKLPQTFTFEMQPNSIETLGDLSLGSSNGSPCLFGTVLAGFEVIRTARGSHTRSTNGTRRTVYGIKIEELHARRAVRYLDA